MKFAFLFLLLFPLMVIAQQRKIIFTDKAPMPVGPYSQAVKAEEMIFVSGQIALTVEGKMDTLTIESETKQVMENLNQILLAAKLSFRHVVKATIFLTDMKNFARVNEVYAAYFKSGFPARETVEVRALPKGAHIEISLIAVE